MEPKGLQGFFTGTLSSFNDNNPVFKGVKKTENKNKNYKKRRLIMKVRNMTSNNGNQVPNQFIIETSEGEYFQSYDSVIAFKPYNDDPVQLDIECWDYSVTTGRYRNIFLNEMIAETRDKIASGEYILTDLNDN